ncbi:uncharacterized protein LOC143597232 [Bidens hawaiensis]|uniref:uncharacterized protein LOC143597232 n=1 Tax=Bidens hawaiensis TaxID=980011 RepID=UPI004049DC21
MSPFRALYGREVTVIHDYVPRSTKTGSIEASMILHQQILQSLKVSITAAKSRIVKQANKKRIDKEFAVGDFVLLRLHKYRQKSVHHRLNQKLSRRYYGPYKIIERIGKVAYKLDLPTGSKIHPIFHVSLLKQSYGDKRDPAGDLKHIYPDIEISSLPKIITDSRVIDENCNKY